MNRAQLIVGVVRRQIERGEVVRGSGTLEVLPDGYGFLRSPAHNYLASPEDIYVSPSQIRRMGLRTGLRRRRADPPADREPGQLRPDADRAGQRQAGRRDARTVTSFDDLTPLHPNKRLVLETDAGRTVACGSSTWSRPIGKGQRGLIVAPPRTGKTILLSKMANAIIKNHPECYVFVLLVDERPEEVTEMQRLVQRPERRGGGQHVRRAAARSTSTSPTSCWRRPSGWSRLKQDVVILLDSITRLARAHNTEAPGGGKLLSGGLDTQRHAEAEAVLRRRPQRRRRRHR